AALYRGYEVIMKLLLNKDANVNARFSNALYIALARGYKVIIKLLLNKDANVNV
ncbi:hypothetical protein CC80DRAFT_418517, partial [Byssothecium circinans]